jgi:hypothetical protein
MYTSAVGPTFFQSASQYDIQFNLLMAASPLVVMAPVITLFLIFQRAFVQGISFGVSMKASGAETYGRATVWPSLHRTLSRQTVASNQGG